VFDGEPPRLKARTIQSRGEIKRRAEREWREAVEIGDLATARTKAMQTSRLTGEMIDQSKRLLDLLGVPVVQAPGEGEAQASAMARDGTAYAAASQDFDALLFGSPRLVKNLAISGRRKMPRKELYVEVHPEEISLEATLAKLGITREQLVDMGLLMGTDFNEGVKGIGPKKALALIKKHGTLEGALQELGVDIESKDEVRKIFLYPNVLDHVELVFRDPDPDGVRRMLCEEFDFSPDRINAALEKFGIARSEQKQRSLDSWFR
jgi:flap endonuclease-1